MAISKGKKLEVRKKNNKTEQIKRQGHSQCKYPPTKQRNKQKTRPQRKKKKEPKNTKRQMTMPITLQGSCRGSGLGFNSSVKAPFF